ncbi:MAG: hypothetical protein AAB546_04485 [Patescibacteria group bacterium]
MTYKDLLLFGTTIGLLVSLFIVFPGNIQAKKVLPRFTSSTSNASKTNTTAVSKTKPQISVKFRSDRRAIIVTFSNLPVAKSVSYNLVYTANGVEQGFGGSITDLNGTQTREIVLGTCSHGICRYDTAIKNAKFSVTYKLFNGKTYVKNFKLKI